ncbi:MAG: hypothetical protein GY822_01005 [Deltaproteobacteria bacterium]|nr:hypothetical protein [Deltaproteobacteria bacterium]
MNLSGIWTTVIALRTTLLFFVLCSSACATGEPDDDNAQDAGEPDAGSSECDWDTSRFAPTMAPTIPSTTAGELGAALLGRWQHTFLPSPRRFYLATE